MFPFAGRVRGRAMEWDVASRSGRDSLDAAPEGCGARGRCPRGSLGIGPAVAPDLRAANDSTAGQHRWKPGTFGVAVCVTRPGSDFRTVDSPWSTPGSTHRERSRYRYVTVSQITCLVSAFSLRQARVRKHKGSEPISE